MMKDTRWVWFETVEGDHQWVSLEDVKGITKYAGGTLYEADFSGCNRLGNIRAFSVHAAPSEIHPKKEAPADDTFTVHGS